MGIASSSSMPRSCVNTFRVPCSAESLILAFRDEGLYRRFHHEHKDHHLRVTPFTTRGAAGEERTSEWTFSTPSAIRTFANGAPTTRVREVTRVNTCGNGTVFTQRVTFGGCAMFEQISALSEVIVRGEGATCCSVTAKITCTYKASSFCHGYVESGTLDSLLIACKKWIATAARAAPTFAAAAVAAKEEPWQTHEVEQAQAEAEAEAAAASSPC